MQVEGGGGGGGGDGGGSTFCWEKVLILLVQSRIYFHKWRKKQFLQLAIGVEAQQLSRASARENAPLVCFVYLLHPYHRFIGFEKIVYDVVEESYEIEMFLLQQIFRNICGGQVSAEKDIFVIVITINYDGVSDWFVGIGYIQGAQVVTNGNLPYEWTPSTL
jgi:hypothetical protein